MNRILLTLRTARHLRPEQVTARASFAAERRLARLLPGLLSRRNARKLAAIRGNTIDAAPVWRWPPAPFDPAARASPDRAADVASGRFTFLNRSADLGLPPDWRAHDTSRLWRFHLHGFGYAVDLAASARRGHEAAYGALRTLVLDWLQRHPVSPGDPWHPFVVADRTIAWQIARDLLRRDLAADPELDRRLRDALLLQALFLEEHLETDVGGNHLLKDAVALLAAGCAFEGPTPERWRRRASHVLEAELPRQVLPDGGHYERSPMYHLLVLADLLFALGVAGRRELSVSVPIANAVRRMQRVAAGLVHPDGEIPLFNDAALGEATPPAALVGPSTVPLGDAYPDSGYFKLSLDRPAPGGVLIADCGPPGPDDLPAHVHADALSFELSVGRQRVLVDGGVLEYERGPLRDRLRGTASHNTVEVDGVDQSEVWDSFRVGDRARVRLEEWSAVDGARRLVGSHDGYARLGVLHRRELAAVPGSGWRVLDTLWGTGDHRAEARLRLHPDLSWRPEGDDYLAVDRAGVLLLCVRPFGSASAALEEGIYGERFGDPRAISVLRLSRQGPLPFVFGAWLLLPGGEPAVV